MRDGGEKSYIPFDKLEAFFRKNMKYTTDFTDSTDYEEAPPTGEASCFSNHSGVTVVASPRPPTPCRRPADNP